MNFNELLNDEQLLPVTNTEGQVLVLAGAGSGKTRVLTYRIAYLLEKCGVLPYNILAITFTNKATAEMRERIASVTGVRDIWVSTFHSFCSRVLREDIDKLGYGKNFTIYTDSDSDRLLTRLIKNAGIDDSNFKPLLRWHISTAKNRDLSPLKYSEVCVDSKGDLIYKLYDEYERELRDANALDFDDLLLKTIHLFKDYPDVLGKYQERFKYIHIDEFQDTNVIQYVLVKMLAHKWKNVFVVGDDDQSIYGWRGAEVGNIRNFKKYYPACKVFKLQRNYRSTGNILKCANAVIANNSDRMGKTLWTDSGEGFKVEYKSCYDDRGEADFCLKEISGLCTRGSFEYKDFAILVRLNSITRAFEEKMNMYGIPYRIYGGFKFYERKEIKDLMAYLRIISNPKDNEAIFRIINFPKRGIGDMAVENMRRFCNTQGISFLEGVLNVEASDLTNTTKSKIAVFKELVLGLQEANGRLPLSDFVAYLIKVLDFDAVYDKDVAEDNAKLMNINEFLAGVIAYEKDNPNVTLDEYLQSLALVSETDTIADDNCVTIATVHAVKGLEFRCVFIVGCEEKIFPSARAMDTPSEMEEERRVMYVALTRARERLYLTNAQTRFRFGKYENNLASRFVKECGIVIKADEKVKNEFATGVNRSNYKPSTQNLVSNMNHDFSTKKVSSANEKDISVFKSGMSVLHRTYGEGMIIEINGENAHIAFKGLGVKQFNLRLAPLEVKG